MAKKELEIVTLARQRGMLAESPADLKVGVEYMLVPKEIHRRDRLCGVFTMTEFFPNPGQSGNAVFNIAGEPNGRLFSNYWILKL